MHPFRQWLKPFAMSDYNHRQLSSTLSSIGKGNKIKAPIESQASKGSKL